MSPVLYNSVFSWGYFKRGQSFIVNLVAFKPKLKTSKLRLSCNCCLDIELDPCPKVGTSDEDSGPALKGPERENNMFNLNQLNLSCLPVAFSDNTAMTKSMAMKLFDFSQLPIVPLLVKFC